MSHCPARAARTRSPNRGTAAQARAGAHRAPRALSSIHAQQHAHPPAMSTRRQTRCGSFRLCQSTTPRQPQLTGACSRKPTGTRQALRRDAPGASDLFSGTAASPAPPLLQHRRGLGPRRGKRGLSSRCPRPGLAQAIVRVTARRPWRFRRPVVSRKSCPRLRETAGRPRYGSGHADRLCPMAGHETCSVPFVSCFARGDGVRGGTPRRPCVVLMPAVVTESGTNWGRRLWLAGGRLPRNVPLSDAEIRAARRRRDNSAS